MIPRRTFWLGTALVDLGGVGAAAVADDLPRSARLVIVPYGDAGADQLQTRLSEIRRLLPVCRIVVYLPRGSADEVSQAMACRVDDVAVGEAHLRHRLEVIDRELRVLEAYAARLDAHEGLRGIIDEMLASPELQDVLRAAIMRMSELFSIERVSVVLFKPGDEHAFIVARHGDELENLVIRISDYPELQEITRTREPLLIPDILGDALLSGVRGKLATAQVPHRSSMLFPLLRKDEAVGALFLRSRQAITSVEDRLLSMGRLIASVTAIAIGNALETDALLREQRVLIRRKADVDQLLADLRPFSDFFAQAHDGIVVTDLAGTIRFANAAAASILRLDTEELKRLRFVDLLGPQYRALAERAYRGQAVGDAYGYVDLLVPTVDDEVMISAGIRVLGSPEGVLVSFRDVTEIREIENELRQTKEFLENLIQSSVDAIIAADTEGRIILFNRAAESLVGHAAREVVGRLTLADLYPPGEAEDVMRRLRSEAYGGRGRLDLLRKDLLAKSGELVPVNLSAAIIYESGSEVASVSIFADLRERLKMEDKLNRAQRQLQLSERQSVAVELAGAAAHELNQPLTSIMGYAEILKRRLSADDPQKKPIEVIARETERMAEIVKRIGQITAYKAKPYVGRSTILDFGASAEPGTIANTRPDPDAPSEPVTEPDPNKEARR